MSNSGAIRFEGAVKTYAAVETPYRRELTSHGLVAPSDRTSDNADYGLWQPGVGLLVADGVGRGRGALNAARIVTRAVAYAAVVNELSKMPTDEAKDVIREVILPYADGQLAEFHRRTTDPEAKASSTTLAAALLLRGSNIAVVGVGDPRVYQLARRKNGGDPEDRLLRMLQVQGDRSGVFNSFNGEGRPNFESGDAHPLLADPAVRGMFLDQVITYPIEPGDRLLLGTDGFFGDTTPEQTIPDEHIMGILGDNMAAPEAKVDRLMLLPSALYLEGLQVPVTTPAGAQAWVPYRPSLDDTTIGVLEAHAA